MPPDVPADAAPAAVNWLSGGGEMGKLIRSMDWASTPLGPIESWPQSLRTTVSLCLASNFPISIAWGPHRAQIYNDGYWPICGGKHPHSMGQDFKECWFSAWPAIGEAFERASAGETSFIENRRMFLDRNGYLEETFFTFSFSPIRDETGGVGGLFHRVGQTLSAELDLPTLVQAVTDAATALTGAQFGAFFYNVSEARGESYMLYTLAGASREQFAQFPLPRNTALFGPTFRGTGIVRLADVRQDRRYGQSAPYYGLPPGHLPVTSYLAVPVVSRSGEILGGLFFGHPETGVFTDRHERLIVGLAAQAAVAIDNARLFAAAQQEINERQQLEVVLRESEQRYRHLFDTAGVSLLVEDFSAVNDLMAQLQAQGVTDFRRFFAAHPEVVEQAIELVQVVDVNATTVRMFDA